MGIWMGIVSGFEKVTMMVSEMDASMDTQTADQMDILMELPMYTLMDSLMGPR